MSLGKVGGALPKGVVLAPVAACLSLLGSGGDLQSTVTWPRTASSVQELGLAAAAKSLELEAFEAFLAFG